MKIKNLKIGTQVIIVLSAMLFFVLILGGVANYQSGKIREQAENIYNHPLQVQEAIGMLNTDILQIRLYMRGLTQIKNEAELQTILGQIDLLNQDAHRQTDSLYKCYLGPRADIDTISAEIVEYASIRAETIRLFRAGKIEIVTDRVSIDGIGGVQNIKTLKAINRIRDFAARKSLQFYQESHNMNTNLSRQLLILVFLTILLSFVIYFQLLRNLRRPLNELTTIAQRFQAGDLLARSTHESKSEIGMLSASFNTMAESIRVNLDLSEKKSALAAVMLREDDARNFFRKILAEITLITDSQMGAVYLLSESKQSFEHFESLGLDENARKAFSAVNPEGEVGLAVSSGRIQHIKNIPDDTRFTFNTVGGKFIPREIISIPILVSHEVIAVISLGSVGNYSELPIMLISSIMDILGARVEGILAYRKIREFSERMEQQNLELEAQKTELSAQSAELMEQNTELEIQKQRLDEVSRLKTTFLSNMSHELRTPLNSVIALSGVLNRRLKGKIPGDEYSYIDVIERNGKHLLELINDILDISRIEAGHEEVGVTTFNPDDVIGDVIGLLHIQAEQKKIKLIHGPGGKDTMVKNDIAKCRHILQNLVGNAVKFTENGSVVVAAKKLGEKLHITVSDSGIGIAQNNLPFIFDEFRQADGSTSRRFGGTGLGLAIAKKYANLLGGEITVESSIGKGSVFTLILPLQYDTESGIIVAEPVFPRRTVSAKPSQGKVSLLSGKTILLVEDSEPAIIQVKEFLEEGGYKVMVAHEGREALEMIAGHVPDAIILDLMMPGVDGFEVLRILREEERTSIVPVLILTAKHVTKEELSFLKRNNIHELIRKGDVNRDELMGAVDAMVSAGITEIPSLKYNRPQIVGKPFVLIVEDNPDNMITVKALLEGDYITAGASDGETGIWLAKQHVPDLILMDIALPAMDGIEAFRTIRNDPQLQHIPVIALTASAMTTDRETILAYGFDAYIAKPIDDTTFFKTINSTIHGA